MSLEFSSESLIPHVLAFKPYALKLTALSPVNADDLIQEVCLSLLIKSRVCLEPESNLDAFIRTLIRNRHVDMVRSYHIHSGKHEYIDKVEEELTHEPEQERAAILFDCHRRFLAILKPMPKKQQQALMHRFHDGMSQKETADALGISEDAVESLTARGRRKVKSSMNFELIDN